MIECSTNKASDNVTCLFCCDTILSNYDDASEALHTTSATNSPLAMTIWNSSELEDEAEVHRDDLWLASPMVGLPKRV